MSLSRLAAAASFVAASLALVACKEPPTPNPNPPTTPTPQPTATTSPATPTSAAVESSATQKPVGDSTAAAATPPEPPTLKPGDPAPALVATASNGTKIDLADIAKKKKLALVYFYPKDDTPGCTKEACAFRDAWKKLDKAKIVVIGVSEDDDASHKAFAAKYKLPIPLLADVDGAIAKKFGVPVDQGYAHRMSFLVAPDGTIKKVYPKVDPAVHCDEVIADAGGGGA
jgi:peroxiredoxin Q/BCP